MKKSGIKTNVYGGNVEFPPSPSAPPYNEETRRLLGTSDEAPEYYRYWEDIE